MEEERVKGERKGVRRREEGKSEEGGREDERIHLGTRYTLQKPTHDDPLLPPRLHLPVTHNYELNSYFITSLIRLDLS